MIFPDLVMHGLLRPLDTWQNLGPALPRGEIFCKGHQDMYHTMM